MSERVTVQVKTYRKAGNAEIEREYQFYAPWYKDGREPRMVVGAAFDGCLDIQDRATGKCAKIPSSMVAHLGAICDFVTEPKFHPIDTASPE